MDDWYGRGDALVSELAAKAVDGDAAHDGEIVVQTFGEDVEDGAERKLEELSQTVVDALPVRGIHLKEELVKDNLEELLLLLIGLHGETHGKRLMTDVANLTDVQLSPGTLYPVLHDLESEGVLSMHKRVRTKAYEIAETEKAIAKLERSMIQHFTFGLLQYAFLSEYRRR